MDKKTKHLFLLVAFGIFLYAILLNAEAVTTLLGSIWSLFLPVLLGFVIAFVLNVPMAGFEKLFAKLTKKWKRQPKEALTVTVSLVLTLLFLLAIIAAIVWLLIPTLVNSLTSLYQQILQKWPEWAALLQQYDINTARITEFLNNFDLESMLQKLTSGAGSIIGATVGAVSSVVSAVVSFFISAIIACYVLVSKKVLGRQAKKLVCAYTKPTTAAFLLRTAELIKNTFSRFISGQCLEACILGVLMFTVMSIFRMPYAPLVGVLTAVCAFVPYIGSFVSCAVGAFLVLLLAPQKVLIYIIIYIAVQFVETQFIYPHVVGSSVGLSPLWTLVAVLIGGKLFGLFGMILFIPLVAVFVEILSDNTNYVLKKKMKQTPAEPSGNGTPPDSEA